MVKEPLDSKIHTFTLILCDTQRTSSTTTTATIEEITTHFQQKLCCQPGFTNYRNSSPLFSRSTDFHSCVCVCLLTCLQSRSLARLSYHTVLLIVIAWLLLLFDLGIRFFKKKKHQTKPNRTKPSLSL